MHNPEKLFICDQCGKTFPDLSRLKLHNRHEHFNEPRPERVPQQCVYCGKWYSSASSIYKHLRNIHSNNDVEHRCQICGFVSTTATALKKHIQFNHEMTRKYKCSVCEKGFKRPQDLKVDIYPYTLCHNLLVHDVAKTLFSLLLYRSIWPHIQARPCILVSIVAPHSNLRPICSIIAGASIRPNGP